MKNAIDSNTSIDRLTTAEICSELGNRFKVRYGKIQITFHEGRPAEFVEIDLRASLAKPNECGDIKP